MSDACRWSRVTSPWSALNGQHSRPSGKRQPWRRRRLFPQQQIVSHMAPCRGRRLGTMWNPPIPPSEPRHGTNPRFSILPPKPRCGSYSAHVLLAHVGLHRPRKLNRYFTDVWLIGEKRIKAVRIRSCYKTSSHARLFFGPVADRSHFEDGSKWYKLFLKRAVHRI